MDRRKPSLGPGLFQSAVDHFHDLGQARTKVIIFVSDGDASISPQRHDDLVKLMHEPGQVIHIYAFIVGDKSQISSPSTQSVRDLVRDVGGEVICAGDVASHEGRFQSDQSIGEVGSGRRKRSRRTTRLSSRCSMRRLLSWVCSCSAPR